MQKGVSITISYKDIVEYNKTLFFFFGQTLEKTLKDFFKSNKVKIKGKKYYYLFRNTNEIQKLDIKKTPEKINLLKDDIIKIFDNEVKIENSLLILNANKNNTNKDKNQENIGRNSIVEKNEESNNITSNEDEYKKKYFYSERKNIGQISKNKIGRVNKKFKQKKLKSLKDFIKICIITILLIAIIIIIIYLLTFIVKKNLIKGQKPEEILQANIIYKKGEIYLYKSKERTDVFSEGEKDTDTSHFDQYKYYLLLIKEEHYYNSSNVNKSYYTGFFSLFNSYIENDTHLILSQSDDKINEILEKIQIIQI